MRLYKFMSLANLWRVLEIVHRNRIFCARWQDLNDPMEGNYELFYDSPGMQGRTNLESKIKENRDRYRIASFSKSSTNFLLWSHYADGHKGVAIEVKIDPDEPNLTPVTYSPFNQIFTEHSDLDLNYPSIFHGKYTAWRYEKEWRIVTTEPYFSLSTPCRKILLGPRIEREQSEILRMALPKRVRLVETRIENSIGENLPRVVPIKRKAIESRDGNSNP